ncbi:MAG: ADP-glyceromanno-heptose 6-epimerase [Saprospiraceae bacterium]|nr:ADP-glyceromanno-heptose 6-epimerase [Saprospiraceae bacterium]
MIVVTGAAGFIGSCLVSFLNRQGHEELILVDAIEKKNAPNLIGKKFREYIDRDLFLRWFENNAAQIEFVFHIGARTDTTEWNEQIFEELNLNYSKHIWQSCASFGIPLVYASSAATYGDGSFGYSDDHGNIPKLRPLNPYGWSKQYMDQWVLTQDEKPDRWAGFKFFNVFGPNEYHKGRMASVIYHAFHQIQNTGKMKLFRSNDPSIKDGEQKRDFIYVMDLLQVLYAFYKNIKPNGIYNLGSGEANTFKDLVKYCFEALDLPEKIEFIDMPIDLVNTYQNYTCAEMQKLYQTGYDLKMCPFRDSVNSYVKYYLQNSIYY